MRTYTAQHFALLHAEDGYVARARVRVLRGATWVDLSLIGEPDWDALTSVQVESAVDSPTTTARVTLPRELLTYSFSPYVAGSAINTPSTLLALNATFIVEVGLAPLDSEPTSYTEIFRGRIDSVDWGPDAVTVEGRDLFGQLQDVTIEEERPYGSPSGTALETVLASILTDNGLSVTLQVPTSPSFLLSPFVQRKEPVADALLELVRNIGWELRYRYNTGAGAWQLYLYTPDRAPSSVVWDFRDGEYYEMGSASYALDDVRNVVTVTYSDRADLDAAGYPKRKRYTSADASSIAAYGRKAMELAEDSSKGIDTAVEAQRLTDTAIADLSTPWVTVAITTDVHPFLEVQDYVRVQPDGLHFSAAQDLAVVGYTHTFEGGSAHTQLQLRGKPSISRRSWQERESLPGVAPAPPLTGPEQPTGLVVQATVNGLALEWAPPTQQPFPDTWEVHTSASSGFTPSDATLATTVRATRADLTTFLASAGTLYARVVPRDKAGNRGTASAEVTVTPRYVEPRFLQPSVALASLPLNPGFEAQNDAAAPPDGWALSSGTWGTSAVTTSGSLSGARSVLLKNNAAIRSQAMSVVEERTYGVEVVVARDPFVATDVELRVVWMTAAMSVISTVVVRAVSISSSGAVVLSGRATAPATTRYAALEIANVTVAITSFGALVDNCLFELLPSVFTQVTPTSPFAHQDVTRWPVGYYHAAPIDAVVLAGVLLGPSTAPAAYSAVMTLPDHLRPARDRLVRRVWSDGTVTDIEVLASTGVVQIQTTPAGSRYMPLDSLIIMLQA